MATRSLNDFVNLLIQLQPRGPFWDWLQNHPQTAIRYQRYKAYAEELLRVDNRREDLLTEALPSTAVELLPDYEELLGIVPIPTQSIAERQQFVVAKLFSAGDQSVGFYQSINKIGGNSVASITKFAPRTSGQAFGRPYGSADFRWLWVFNIQGTQNSAYEEFLTSIAPAHIQLTFNYLGAS